MHAGALRAPSHRLPSISKNKMTMTKTAIRTMICNCALSISIMGVAMPAFAAIKDPQGMPAAAATAHRTITITPSTKHVNVVRNEIVRFINPDNGQSFTWQFHTHQHPVIDLRAIAPGQFVNHKVLVYVAPNPDEQG